MTRTSSLVISIALLLGCSDTTDVSDTDTTARDGSAERLLCESAVCGEGRICVQDNGPATSCADAVGSCILAAPLCPESSDYQDGWAACACGTTEYSSACSAREAGERSRLYLCRAEFQGASCDPTTSSPTCPSQDTCVLLAGKDGRQGRCMPISAACATAPAESACLSNLGSSLDSVSECYSTPCAAWQQGYRGPIALAP